MESLALSIARTLWVNAWASWAEENDPDAIPQGADLMDEAPETPPMALVAAGVVLAGIGFNIYHFLSRDDVEDDPDEAGYLLAMEALGQGVSWEDDHSPHELDVPGLEVFYDGEDFGFSGGLAYTKKPSYAE